MSCEKEQIKRELENLKKQQQELRERIREIEFTERLEAKKRIDVASRLQNRRFLDFIFPYYDNLYDSLYTGGASGKVALRRNRKSVPHEFEIIRKVAHTITDYVVLSKRRDNYVEQKTVHRKLNQLDDKELDLVSNCADEIIATLYKYKKLCSEYQKIDYAEFIVGGSENAEF